MSLTTHVTTNPAIENLLEAFKRWQKEEDSAKEVVDVQDATGTSRINGQDTEPIAIPTPVPIAFLRSLPHVDPAELPEDRRDCGICFKPMCSHFEWCQNNALDLATRMPCGHVLGFCCLYQWFNPCNGANNNNCPYCRAVCFERFADEDSLEGLTQRLNALEWGIVEKERRPSPRQRIWLCYFRMNIVYHLIDEASRELDLSRREINRQLAQSTGRARATNAEYNRDSPAILLEYHLHRALIHGVQVQLRVTQIRHDLEASHARANEAMALLDRIPQENQIVSAELTQLGRGETRDQSEESEEGEMEGE